MLVPIVDSQVALINMHPIGLMIGPSQCQIRLGPAGSYERNFVQLTGTLCRRRQRFGLVRIPSLFDFSQAARYVLPILNASLL